MGKGKRYTAASLVLVGACGVTALIGRADNFFVDGYHGGIYGHYPVEWKTQFIVDQLREHPQWRIGLEIEPETWDTVQVRTPQAYREFADMMRSGRMEYTNPTYAQPYCFNVEGESIIRQFSYGIEKLRNHFPDITFTTYSTEEPCFTSCLPAILKGFGFKYASLKCPNTCWGGYMAPYGGQLVNWIGPDGTSILTVPRYECEELEPKSVWQTTAWGNSPRYLEACWRAGIENPVGMCYQDAGWRNGPWLNKNRSGSRYVLWTEYINDHTPGVTDNDYHLTQNDVKVNLMWGSQVMQRIGRQVRRAENNMFMAEKMGALALMAGADAEINQPVIDEAWRQLMLAQHHDSWIVPYNGLWHFGTWADAIALWTDFATSAARSQMTTLARGVDGGNSTMVKVFNTTSLQRSEPVVVELPASWGDAGVELTDAEGHKVDAFILPGATDKNDNIGKKDSKVNRLLFKATVPPAGYATYAMRRVPANDRQGGVTLTPRGAATAPVLENDEVRLEIDLVKGGTVKSLILKNADSGKDVEFAPADTCRFAMGEMRGYFYEQERFRSSAESAARVVDFCATPHSQTITLAGEIAGHPYTRTYQIASGSNRVNCRVNIDWQGNPGIGEYRERHWNHDRRGFCDDSYKLCVLLPTAFDAPRLWKDAPFDVCESTDTDTRFNRWSQIKHNLILNWVDAADAAGERGLGLISDHTTSYVHGGGMPLGLTIQYSGPGLWGPDYRITGPSEVEFAIVPHVGSVAAEALADEADRFNEPLQAFLCGGNGVAKSASLCNIAADGYRISSAMSKDGGVELRVHNTHASEGGSTVTVAMPHATVTETDLAGNDLGTVDTRGTRSGVAFGVDIPRNGFATFKLLKNNAVAEFNIAPAAQNNP